MTQSGIANANKLRSFLELLWLPGDVREVRIPRYNEQGYTASGYFDSADALARAAAAWDGRANIYLTLNPVQPACISRARNRILDRTSKTTADSDILKRSWLFLDFDPRREGVVSSTADELLTAEAKLHLVVAFLTEEGWPEPVVAMSGNGFYALYRIDLPNGQYSTGLVGDVLSALDEMFSSEHVHIDTTVSNASRLIGLVGTLKVKGEHTLERPHRRSRLEAVPDSLEVVPEEKLQALASLKQPVEKPKVEARANANLGGVALGLSLRQLLDEHTIEHRVQPPDANGIEWYHVRRCPFHDDECQEFECGVGQKLPDGHFAGHCFHPQGVGKGWQEWKERWA